jgi:hypothetical protein
MEIWVCDVIFSGSTVLRGFLFRVPHSSRFLGRVGVLV